MEEQKVPEDLEPQVIEIINQVLEVDKDEITRDAYYVGDLGADSIDTAEIIIGFEDQFGIEVFDEETEDLDTVGKLIDFLEKTIEEQK